MFREHFGRILRLMAVAASVWMSCGTVTTAAGAEGAKPAPICVVAVKSVDAVQDFTGQLGIPLPVSVDQIERMFPFIGAGNLARNQPLGVVFFAGGGVKPNQAIAFVLPVKDGVATAQSLKDMGAKPIEGQPDSFMLSTIWLRRTEHHIIFTPMADVGPVTSIELVTGLLKGPDSLARLSVDIKAIRDSAPELLAAFMDSAKKNTKPAASGSEQAGEDLAFSAFQSLLDNLDQFQVGVDKGASGLSVNVSVRPIKPAAQTLAGREAMPADVFARLDMSGLLAQQLPADFDWLDKLIESGSKDEKAPITPNQKQQVKAIVSHLRTVLVGDAGTDVGVEMHDGSPVVYVVEHYSKPVDVEAELRDIVDRVNKFDTETKVPKELEFKVETVGAAAVSRVTFVDRESPLYIEAVSKDNSVLITISKSDRHVIDRLLDSGAGEAPAAGRGMVAAGWLDLGKLFDVAVKAKDSPLTGMPADKEEQARALLAGLRVSATVAVDDGAGTFEIRVPDELVRRLPKLMPLFGIDVPPPAEPK